MDDLDHYIASLTDEERAAIAEADAQLEQDMRMGTQVGELACVRGHLFREEELSPADFTASRRRGWCPISSCRMPLRRVAMVDRRGRAWTEPLV